MKETNRKLTLIAILVATFLCAMEATIVSTAMPSIIRDLNGMRYVSMIFSIYLLTNAVTTPIYGKLADIFGRKKILSLAVVLFLTGSVLSGLSHTMLQLILFRALQGLGAGSVLPISSTIIADIFNTEERTRMQPLLSGVWAVSGVIGPLIGGFIVEVLNWRWIFYINLPFGIASLLLLNLFFHEKFQERERQPIDWAGASLFLAGITSLLYVLLFGGQSGYFSTANLLLEVCCVVCFVGFVKVEQRAKDPFLSLSLMRNRLILVPNLFGFFAFSFLIATTVYLPIWIQQILHLSPTISGFALTSSTLGWPLGASIISKLLQRFSPWRISITGACLLVVSGVALSLVTVHTPIAAFFVIMFLAGFAFGLTTTVFMIILQNAVEWQQRGVAMGSNALLNTLGQTVFIAVFGAIYNAVSAQDAVNGMPHGIRIVFFCVLLITVVAFFIALRMPKVTREQLFGGGLAG